uniref:Uncharacterized protein n=1 Tax=Avena sativa TaxID=4498 RepID=A0ACD5Z832_AVESA
MGEASANMAHWAGLYGATGAGGNGGAAATAEGSGVTVSSPTSGGSGGGSPARSAPGVEGGRVGKPARRRSRASRRAPVTLLNTDTSNFRAMVQQFTGIPSGPYGPAGGGPVISFGAGGSSGVGMPVRPSPTSAVMSFDHLGGQYQQQQHRPAVTSSLHQQQQQQQQSQLFRPQQQQQFGGDFGAMLGGGGGDMFLHGFGSSAEDRMLLQSIQAAQMMPRPASTNNTNGYNFG